MSTTSRPRLLVDVLESLHGLRQHRQHAVRVWLLGHIHIDGTRLLIGTQKTFVSGTNGPTKFRRRTAGGESADTRSVYSSTDKVTVHDLDLNFREKIETLISRKLRQLA